MRFAASLSCVLLLPGCSFMFVRGAPSQHETLEHFDCNSSYAAPATDAFFGGTYALVALIIAGSSNADYDSRGSSTAIVGALGAAFLGSMVYGILECSDCADAKEQLRERQLAAERAKDRLIADLQRQLELSRQPLQLAPAARIVAPSSPAAAAASPATPPPATPAPAPPAEATPVLPP